MKANELMIGDWVMFQHGIDKIVDLPYISGKGLCASFSASATLFPVPIEQLKPIPLTLEILEKNGFIPATNGVSWRLSDNYTDECLIMLDKIYNAFVMSTAGMTIGFQYVHQLQHALRLCGIIHNIEV